MINPAERLSEMGKHYPCVIDLCEHINQNYKQGQSLMGMREMVEYVGYNRLTIRESMLILRALGYVDIFKGKPVKVLKVPPRLKHESL